jgi:hypothetical protein
MWPVNAESTPRDDKRVEVEPTTEENSRDSRLMDDPRELDDWPPDEAGYGHGV